MPIPQINPGQRITAAWLNEIVDAINAGLSGQQPGIGRSFLNEALSLALVAALPELFEPVRIIRVKRGQDVLQTMEVGQPLRPILSPEWPTQVTYDVTSIRRGWSVESVTPTYGRPVRGNEAKVYPASAGMLAVYVRGPKFRDEQNEQRGKIEAQLMLLPGSEVVYRRQCTPQTPGPIIDLGIPPPLPIRERLAGGPRLISSSGEFSAPQSPSAPGGEGISGNDGGFSAP